MNQETLDHSHWVIDNDFEDIGFERIQKISIESIESQIRDLSTFNVSDGVLIQGEDMDFLKFRKIKFKLPIGQIFRKQLYFYKKTQNWIGVVDKIVNTNFHAKLFEKNKSSTYEIAEFDFNEVSKSDLSLIKIGAVFYYSIGFASNNGQIKKESFLRFQRSVPFDNDDVDSIENKVQKFDGNILWE